MTKRVHKLKRCRKCGSTDGAILRFDPQTKRSLGLLCRKCSRDLKGT
jgi:hypothetical protein